MKNNRFNMLVKASIKDRKLSSVMFCSFVIISFVLVYITLSLVIQLWQSIDTKINNHISNRELVAVFSQNVSDDYIEGSIEEIKAIENVEDIYRMPTILSVTDLNTNLYNMYDLSYVHKYYEPTIIDGRGFSENETGVALVPKNIKDYNAQEGIIAEIDGADLISTTLKFEYFPGISRDFEVIGTYDTTDPIFSGKEILVSQKDLIAINDEIIKNPQNSGMLISADKSYIVVIDAKKNVDSVYSELEKISVVYTKSIDIDTTAYNTALIILVLITSLLITLTVAGFYLFLRNDVRNRTNELALYRSIGYKSKDLFCVIFTEYLLLDVISIFVSVGISCLLVLYVVNPYFADMLGNTFMEMSISINTLYFAFIVVGYVLVTLLVCKSAVKRSEKIDLTVLLRE